ncbi:MAG: hypothetical protein V4820_12230 [Pseudomonadota bacterium]|uniref:hypothetical protein n=1 Tax=Phenylobacterium sp. TaxID=1871053 RepID=UPI00271BCBDC|nr:hypothetical protein [Phenylobacterium sp.]MDO9433432.1 hypothetical protein [Phenylobacterium sp.]
MIKTICAAAAMALAAGAAHAQPASQPQQAPPAQPPAQSAGVQVTTSVDSGGVTVHRVTNGPVADTPENRAKFPPLSATGRNTKPQGK